MKTEQEAKAKVQEKKDTQNQDKQNDKSQEKKNFVPVKKPIGKSNKPEKLDYRIKAYKSLIDAVRTGRQFITQKTIRRLRENNNKKQKDSSKEANSKQEKKMKNRQKNLELKLEKLKKLTTLEQKLLALYLEKYVVEIDFMKVDEYLVKHVSEDYKEKLDEIVKQIQAKPEPGQEEGNNFFKYFVDTIQENNKFKQVQQELNKKKTYISKTLNLSKIKRDKKHEKYLLKQQNKGQPQEQNPPKNNENSENTEEGQQQKKVPKIQNKKISKDKNKNKIAQKNPQNKSERTEFKKGGREKREKLKTQAKIDKKLMYAEKAKNNQKPQQQSNVQEKAAVHPSWAAKLEQQKQEKKTQFQGKKIAL